MRELALAAFCSFCALSGLVAQDRSAVLRGPVCDPGKPLPGLRITLTGRASSPVEVTSDADGRYRILGVAPDSHFAVAAKLPAFATLVRDRLTVRSGRETVLNVTIEEAVALAREPLIDVKSNKVLYRAPFIRGAESHWTDKQGLSPLHRAAALDTADEARRLIVAGVDVNARGADGWTPLHIAAYEDRPALAELLLSMAHGADIKAKDRSGRTPLVLADDAGYTGMVELLQKHGARR